jgi:23S rRNA pseudouridine2605 synthase
MLKILLMIRAKHLVILPVNILLDMNRKANSSSRKTDGRSSSKFEGRKSSKRTTAGRGRIREDAGESDHKNKDFGGRKPAGKYASGRGSRKPDTEERDSEKKDFGNKKPASKFSSSRGPRKQDSQERDLNKKAFDNKKSSKKSFSKSSKKTGTSEENNLIRINKFLADAGICSRREADVHIAAGAVMINGKIVTTLGTKVSPLDKVQFGGETLNRETIKYFLLNKPKGFITTSKDPLDRKTVMSLMEHACKERIYPVGRLDKNTLGLLLFTNDGDLAKKLTHPKHNIKKIYHVFLDKPIKGDDLQKIADGLELEDGPITPDKVAYASMENDKKQVGIELHSGKNRIVRRIFEHLGYTVTKLDRVFFAGLTKKDLQRGKFRELTDKEVNLLKRL